MRHVRPLFIALPALLVLLAGSNGAAGQTIPDISGTWPIKTFTTETGTVRYCIAEVTQTGATGTTLGGFIHCSGVGGATLSGTVDEAGAWGAASNFSEVGSTVSWSGSASNTLVSGTWSDTLGFFGTWGGTRCGNTDTDGDSIPDCWETGGIDFNGDLIIDLPLNAAPYNANPSRKDIFVEIDYMDCLVSPACGGGDTHNHKPQLAALNAVTAAFANAPVSNPSGPDGITLHAMIDEGIPEIPVLPLWFARLLGPLNDFDDLKLGNPINPCGTGAADGHFGRLADRASANCGNILEARRAVFRYSVFGHSLEPLGTAQIGGIGELAGNDSINTFGRWTASDIALLGGQADAEAGLFMHEFGHNLGLGHGGPLTDPENYNCKPNYLSIMSYSQTKFAVPTRPLDYSRAALPSLYEGPPGLDESVGVQGPPGRMIVWGVPDPLDPVNGVDDDDDGLIDRDYRVGPAEGPVDWDDDDIVGETGVQADLNDIGGSFDCLPSPGQTLRGANDWANLHYNLRDGLGFATDGFHPTHPGTDITNEEGRAIAENVDFDQDGPSNALDNCPAWYNPAQSVPLWPLPAGDVECDGFSSSAESFIGTSPSLACGVNAWPVDNNDDHKVGLPDILANIPMFNAKAGDGKYNPRYDLNVDNKIGLTDILMFIPFFNRTCTP